MPTLMIQRIRQRRLGLLLLQTIMLWRMAFREQAQSRAFMKSYSLFFTAQRHRQQLPPANCHNYRPWTNAPAMRPARPKNAVSCRSMKTMLTLSSDSHNSDPPMTQQLDESPPFCRDLNPAQIDAVTKPLYSITRVVAGPGSGKTRVLTSRIAYLLEHDPKTRILGVTFTRKAAGEMQQRLESLLRANPVSPQQQSSMGSSNNNFSDGIVEEEAFDDATAAHNRVLSRISLGTFHKICASILRFNGNLLAFLPSVQHDMMGRNATFLDGNFAIMDQSDQLRIMKECLAKRSIDLKDSGVKPLEILNKITSIKSAFFAGEDPFQTDSKQRKLPKHVQIAKEIYGMYREAMLSNNLLDFDDLIYMARELLWENQEVRQQLHRRWTHVLVDEYQDTSRAQIDLVRLWTSNSLLVVGDGDQSIYSWRGADPNSLSTFDEEFKKFLGDVDTVHLMENYRSTANIVKAAQKVIASGEKSMAEKLRQKMKPKRGSGSPPRIIACADCKAEAKFVVNSIQKMVESKSHGPDSTIAILYRTNAQSRVLEEACVQNNLPYVITGKATSFYKRQEVKDCLCYLRWLYNGRDKGSMLRAIKTPSRGLGDKAVQQFEEYCSLVEQAIDDDSRKPTQLDILLSFSAAQEDSRLPHPEEIIATRPLKLFTEFSRQMQSLRDLAYEKPVEDVLAAVINDFDLLAHFEKSSDSRAEYEERHSNVRELQKATRRYTQDGPSLQANDAEPSSGSRDFDDDIKSPLGAFLDDVALVTEMGNIDDRNDNQRLVVNLMTIHAAKGMEFDAVFVVGNEDENFPTSQAIMAGKGSVELAEECRLCFVAMTRAKTDLFLTWRRQSLVFAPNSASGFRDVRRNRSRFLDALVTDKEVKSNKDSSVSAEARKKTARVGSPRQDMVPLTSNGRSTPAFPRSSRSYASTTNGRTSSNGFNSQPGHAGPTRRAISSSGSNGRSAPLRTTSTPSPPTRRVMAPTIGRSSSTSPDARRDLSPNRGSVAKSPPRATMTAPSKSSSRPVRQQSASTTLGPEMDSTWFFPVGSAVIHTTHGRGVVLNPPPPTGDNDLLVRVQFQDGLRMDVSARGSDLKPDA